MTDYSKCKHSTDGIIIVDNNVMSMARYFEWQETVGIFGTKEICWECWNKQLEAERIKNGRKNACSNNRCAKN